MSEKVSGFISVLRKSPQTNHVFNPWQDVDEAHELNSGGPKIRRQQLQHYLQTRLSSAKLLLIGEAVGYQGGHFSGIAMTSERILLGHQKQKGIYPEQVLPDLEPQRTSKPEIMPDGFTEPTATIVWGKLLQLQIKPQEFVLWNTFAWHPYNPQKGLLSNRRPKTSEMENAVEALQSFLELFPKRQVVAVGKFAEEWLRKLEIDCRSVRHPAQGGATQFRKQLQSIIALKL